MFSAVRTLRFHMTHSGRRPSLVGYIELARQRRALAGLSDARLADMGLTRTEAEQEARRPFWDVPQNWVG